MFVVNTQMSSQPTIKNNKRPLRVGLLMDGMGVPAWIAELIRDILKDPCADIAFLVMHDQEAAQAHLPAPRPGMLAKIQRILTGQTLLKRYLYKNYSRWDQGRVRLSMDPFEIVDMSEELKNFPRIRVVPQTDRFFHRFEEKDLERIRAAELDVLLRFGFNIIKGPILESARYGVWSFHHGDNQHFRGGPPYFWELYRDAPLSGIILQILSEKLDAGRVLYRSYTKTVGGLSVKQNSAASYWKGSSFVIRRLRQLHEHGWEWMQKELPTFREDPSIQGKINRIPTNGVMIRFLARSLWRSLSRRVKMRGKYEHWFVAYRNPKSGGSYKTLPWPKGHFYADPFTFERDGKTFIFFEDFLYEKQRGVISFVEVRTDLSTTETQVALDLPHHLSYPFLFEHEGAVYMIPESGANRSVDLFRAAEFPGRWELVKTLKSGLQAYDVTLLIRDGKYWFFAIVVERGAASSDELFLFHADSLTGEWIPHPKNPVVSDIRRARPAGRVFERDGKLIRPSQDGSSGYGGAIQFNEIVVLSETDYLERPISRIEPDWAPNLVGTHTINRIPGLEVIDGRAVMPLSEVMG